jgi:membrane fusion protein (multidrug efflux system)
VRDTESQIQLFLADDSLFPQKGRLVFVDRAVDPKTGTIGVEPPWGDREWIERGEAREAGGGSLFDRWALLVPQLAVQEEQGSKTVLVVGDGDKVALRPVTIDERIGDLYIVTAGLKRGERVIVEGLQKVRPGMQVKPELKPATAAPAAPASPPAGKPKAGG